MSYETKDYWQRRWARRRFLGAGAAGAGFVAAVAVGCGDDDDAAPAKSATQAAAATKAATKAAPAKPKVKRGGDFTVITSTGEQPHHDVHLSPNGVLQIRGSGIVYNRLLRRKLGPDLSDLDVFPDGDLAKSWEQVDPVTFIFKLHPNIKWHNIAPVNGRAMTADDVVYSAHRQIELKKNAAFLGGIAKIEATDKTTVKMTVEKPDADFLVSQTAAFNKVVAKEAVAVKGDLKEGPVIGTGAWVFDQWEPQTAMRFKKNKDYFRMAPDGKAFPYLDTLEMLRVKDQSTIMAAFRTKKISMLGPTTGDPTYTDIDVVKKTTPGMVLMEEAGSGGGTSYVLYAHEGPTKDIRVRQAISKALDRKAMIDTIVGGHGVFGAGVLNVTRQEDMLPEAEAKKLLAHDLPGANKLLKEAGFTGWKPDMSFWTKPATQSAAEMMASQLKKINVDAKMVSMASNVLVGWWLTHDREFAVGPARAFLVGPNADSRATYKTGGSRNTAHLSDPEIDRLIAAQSSELKDMKKRQKLLHDLQRRIIEVAAIMPAYTPQRPTAHWPFLKGLYKGRLLEPTYYEYLWLDE